MSVNIGDKIFLSESVPSIDFKYGPFTSTEAAYEALSSGEFGAECLCIGLTVGIQESPTSPVIEYWFKDATDSKDDLVKKYINEEESQALVDAKIADRAKITDVNNIKAELETKINKKQNQLKVNENNPVVDLNSLTIDNTVYKIAGEAKMGKTFTTNKAIGGIPAGTVIDSSTKLADILYNMLYEPAKPAIYYGALSETQLPPSLANLTKVELNEIPAKFIQNILAGTGEGRYALGQHSTFAVPNNYKITSWIVEGLPDFEFISDATQVQADNYNIYYLNIAEDNRPNGTTYEITITANN